DNWQHHTEKQSQNVHKTFSDVEWITIFFFIGLFIVVHGVEIGGLLHLLANELVAATGGNMATAGYAILWASAFLSAIVDNIPFGATMTPLTKSMAPAYGGADKIEPLWWSLSLGACLGGNGTLIGASANLTVAGIAERNGIPFRFATYVFYGMPMMVVSVAISHVYLWWRFFRATGPTLASENPPRPLSHAVPARPPRRQRLFLHDHDQRFILCSAAVDDQRLAVRARALVAGEVDEFGGNDSSFSGLEQRASLAFDFHGQIAFDHVQQLLGAGMHVPGRGGAGREFDDADDGLLHYLALTLQVLAQNLRQLRPRLRLRQRNSRDGRSR